jgi:hypothetical protein
MGGMILLLGIVAALTWGAALLALPFALFLLGHANPIDMTAGFAMVLLSGVLTTCGTVAVAGAGIIAQLRKKEQTLRADHVLPAIRTDS